MTIVRLCAELSGAIFQGIAILYCEIWKEPPWLEPSWTTEGVLDDLTSGLRSKGTIGFVAFDTQRVEGFTWGFPVTKDDMRNICGDRSLDHLLGDEKRTFYLAELGVSKGSRKRGIGRELTSRLIQEVGKRGFCQILLRTDVRALAARHLYQELGFEELPVTDSYHRNRTYWRFLLR